MRDGGKGDKRRPLSVPEEQFNNNWDAIFKTPRQRYEERKEAVLIDNPLREQDDRQKV